MLALITIVAAVGALVWWIAATVPPDLKPNEASTRAIDNVHNWLIYAMGPRWPVVIGVVVLLLAALLVAVSSANATVSLDPMLPKLVAVLTLGVVALITWKWRTDYTNQHVEFAIILLMLSLNSYLIYRTGSGSDS